MHTPSATTRPPSIAAASARVAGARRIFLCFRWPPCRSLSLAFFGLIVPIGWLEVIRLHRLRFAIHSPTRNFLRQLSSILPLLCVMLALATVETLLGGFVVVRKKTVKTWDCDDLRLV